MGVDGPDRTNGNGCFSRTTTAKNPWRIVVVDFSLGGWPMFKADVGGWSNIYCEVIVVVRSTEWQRNYCDVCEPNHQKMMMLSQMYSNDLTTIYWSTINILKFVSSSLQETMQIYLPCRISIRNIKTSPASACKGHQGRNLPILHPRAKQKLRPGHSFFRKGFVGPIWL